MFDYNLTKNCVQAVTALKDMIEQARNSPLEINVLIDQLNENLAQFASSDNGVKLTKMYADIVKMQNHLTVNFRNPYLQSLMDYNAQVEYDTFFILWNYDSGKRRGKFNIRRDFYFKDVASLNGKGFRTAVIMSLTAEPIPSREKKPRPQPKKEKKKAREHSENRESNEQPEQPEQPENHESNEQPEQPEYFNMTVFVPIVDGKPDYSK